MSDSAQDWQERVRQAHAVQQASEKFVASTQASLGIDPIAESERWLAAVDPTALVGSKHHTVPRFLIERWANRNHQVQVHSRLSGETGTRNIGDLAIRDFYTAVEDNGELNSLMESVLGDIEGRASTVIRGLLNPFVRPTPITPEAIGTLAQFASFQAIRGPRHRREIELQAEWMAKTLARGKITEEELRDLSIVSHPNDHLRTMGSTAEATFPLLICRPLALVTLDRPLLFISDEPLVINEGLAGGTHHADCFLTDEQIESRIRRRRRKDRRGRGGQGRVVHFASTRPTGLGVALEVVLPISPTSALLWGPLQQHPWTGPLQVERLDSDESSRFAEMLNTAISANALDWIATTLADDAFVRFEFPPLGQLMKVCDGDNAAALSMNAVPTQFRPARLWRPKQ